MGPRTKYQIVVDIGSAPSLCAGHGTWSPTGQTPRVGFNVVSGILVYPLVFPSVFLSQHLFLQHLPPSPVRPTTHYQYRPKIPSRITQTTSILVSPWLYPESTPKYRTDLGAICAGFTPRPQQPRGSPRLRHKPALSCHAPPMQRSHNVALPGALALLGS